MNPSLTALHQLADLKGPIALAIGVFDGLHLGHQEVIRAAVEHAIQHDGTAVVLTFDPHPAAVLNPGNVPGMLLSKTYQDRLIRQLGARCLLALPFNQATAATPADDFIAELAAACHPLGCISVGYDWTFGKGREGNVHRLMDVGEKMGFAVYGVPALRENGRVISSTWLRVMIRAGDLELAEHLLGRPFGYCGSVVRGRQLGRTLGFPTANVELNSEVHPPAGVYVCQMNVAGDWLQGVANLGHRPTVEREGAIALEVHLLDWQGDLYDQVVEVQLLAFIRPEQRFPDLESLKKAIHADVATARAFKACPT